MSRTSSWNIIHIQPNHNWNTKNSFNHQYPIEGRSTQSNTSTENIIGNVMTWMKLKRETEYEISSPVCRERLKRQGRRVKVCLVQQPLRSIQLLYSTDSDGEPCDAMRCEYALRIGENPKRAPFTLRLFNKIMGLHPAHWDIKFWAGMGWA